MFLDIVNRRNRPFVDAVLKLHQEEILEADTYVIDMDTLVANAKLILEEASKKGIDLYFMLKQIGRNPIIAKKLVELGYKGAVVVDFREAEIMMQHKIPLGNVGHLVQTPKNLLKEVIAYGTEVYTVFSFEKLEEINEIAKSLNKTQDVIVKVSDDHDLFYSGQMSGIEIKELDAFLDKAKTLENIQVVGATAFPCYLYDEKIDNVAPTPNYYTVIKAIEMMRNKGFEIKQINVPSTTCKATLDIISEGEGTMGEPGHGLTGTTPMHAAKDLDELPAVLYLSEISHNFRGKSYCYGGGLYRRSHVKNGLVVDAEGEKRVLITPVNDDSIDYYFEVDSEQTVSTPVLMAFRFQMFVTRSKVALVEGISSNNPHVIGVYDGLGKVYE